MKEHVIFRWALLLVLTAGTAGIFYNAQANRYSIAGVPNGLVQVDGLTGKVVVCRAGAGKNEVRCDGGLTPDEALAKALSTAVE